MTWITKAEAAAQRTGNIADQARDTAMWLLLGSPEPERVADGRAVQP